MTIVMKNIYKRYDKQYVLKNINLELRAGKIVGIVGKNGAGKTTLMKILCGNIVDFEGSVSYPDSLSNRPIGFLIESPKFYPNQTGFENLKFFSQLFSIGHKENIDNTIKALDMEAYIHKKSKKYSLGMKQRLGIAIALLGNPEFLVLDEPTNGMDPNGIEEILAHLKYLAEERQIGILISSHQLDHIQKVSDYILVMEEGEAVKSIDKDDIVSYKHVTIAVKSTDLQRTKLMLEREGLEVRLDHHSLSFKAKNMNPILKKLSLENIVLQDIEMKEHTLKDIYFDEREAK